MELAYPLPKVTLPLQGLFVSLSWNVLFLPRCCRLTAALPSLSPQAARGPCCLRPHFPLPPARGLAQAGGTQICLVLLLTSLGASGKL